jgi:hypothetical protein
MVIAIQQPRQLALEEIPDLLGFPRRQQQEELESGNGGAERDVIAASTLVT